jgi:lysophospholipid acyltransferase (LPLAT)-like uncharacterized protein
MNDAIARAGERNGAILVTWHGRTLLPIHRFRGRGYWALISLSRDGELQAENFRRFGFRVVRGSTGRRGVLATRETLAALKAGGVLAFTPDGPRGPTHKAQPGVVYFAQKNGCPIIPVGISAYPRWQMRSWDRYLIPKPFSRACWVVSDPFSSAPTTTWKKSPPMSGKPSAPPRSRPSASSARPPKPPDFGHAHRCASLREAEQSRIIK